MSPRVAVTAQNKRIVASDSKIVKSTSNESANKWARRGKRKRTVMKEGQWWGRDTNGPETWSVVGASHEGNNIWAIGMELHFTAYRPPTIDRHEKRNQKMHFLTGILCLPEIQSKLRVLSRILCFTEASSKCTDGAQTQK